MELRVFPDQLRARDYIIIQEENDGSASLAESQVASGGYSAFGSRQISYGQTILEEHHSLVSRICRTVTYNEEFPSQVARFLLTESLKRPSQQIATVVRRNDDGKIQNVPQTNLSGKGAAQFIFGRLSAARFPGFNLPTVIIGGTFPNQ